MPKKIDPELRARAVRLVTEHRGEYQTLTAASRAVAKQFGDCLGYGRWARYDLLPLSLG